MKPQPNQNRNFGRKKNEKSLHTVANISNLALEMEKWMGKKNIKWRSLGAFSFEETHKRCELEPWNNSAHIEMAWRPFHLYVTLRIHQSQIPPILSIFTTKQSDFLIFCPFLPTSHIFHCSWHCVQKESTPSFIFHYLASPMWSNPQTDNNSR